MGMHDQELEVGHQFEDIHQQTEAYTVGMWVFLVTEVLFFGGLFTAYAVYRSWYGDTFYEAHRLLSIPMGGLNTVILLTSSLTMALAVRSSMLNKMRQQVGFLLATIGLAFGFLVVKYFEYSHKVHANLVPGADFVYEGQGSAQQAEMFFSLYFAMTGLHGIHVVVGILVMLALLVRTFNMRHKRQDYIPVELTGLYWHFVDIVWIFLYPLLYLIGR